MVAAASGKYPARDGPNVEHLPSAAGSSRALGLVSSRKPWRGSPQIAGDRTPETTVDAVLGEDIDSTEAEAAEAYFALEYQLRDFLAENLGAIDVKGKKLRLYVDPTGRDGIEFPTAVGPIDILAVDDSGAFFVFELKRGRSPDHAIGQVSRYMGWVHETIGRGREVNGVIVAREIGDGLRYAVSVVPNVSLFEYQVEFHLKPAQDIRGKVGVGSSNA
jgi:endonuclease